MQEKCKICFENINDPICIYCYINQIKIWLEDQELNPVIRKYLINKIRSKLAIEGINSIRCIICKKESVNLCYYCFSELILNFMNEMNFTEDFIDNFSNAFNYNSSDYDLQIAKRNGYYKKHHEDNYFVRR